MTTEVLPDHRALRYGRRERALAAMEAHDLDVLVLGRPANIRYVTGVPQLWNAGTRPFGPGCVLVRPTGDMYLMSTWDEGVPEEIPHERLYGITWDPMNLVSVLRGIGDRAQPRRVGTDAMTPLFAQLLPLAFPWAEVVDGGRALQLARRVKTDEEVAAIRAAITIAEAGLAAAIAELRPGVSERELTGAFMDAIAGHGVTTPANQDVVRITTRRRRNGDHPVEAGDLVAFDAGVVAGGYTGQVGRTWLAGPQGDASRAKGLFNRWDALWARLAEACQPGGRGNALFAAYEAAGETVPKSPIMHGLGLGFDEPLVVSDLPATAAEERLDAGAVVVVTGYVTDSEAGAVIGKEAVLITPTGPEVLTSSPMWNG
jgi:Xaa-Pro aminopeptidase